MKPSSLTKKNIAVIGGGFAGLTAAAKLGMQGYTVDVFEKNNTIGGRARHFSQDGFLFDMGPSWYWMPDVLEKFFQSCGHTSEDFYSLEKLDPGFQIIFDADYAMQIPASFDALCDLFESIEKNSSKSLKLFLAEAAYKYEIAMSHLVYNPCHSITEFCTLPILRDALKLQLFSSFSKHVRSYFTHPHLLALLEFPVLFLGAMPRDTPALYSLMNYAGLQQGTFYPMGGFGSVVNAFEKICTTFGVHMHINHAIENMQLSGKKISALHTANKSFSADAVIASADYHHVESKLLPKEVRNYNEKYWDKKTFAPSCLIFYVGVNKKIKNLLHHNLFFEEDFALHAEEIYKSKKWPSKPLFYVCCPSKTDPSVAPEGKENLFFLMPIAAGLENETNSNEDYFVLMLKRVEAFTKESIREHIILKKSYSVNDFTKDYNAYKGNAYGLANTLLQTAIFKPKLKSKKIENLFFAGQLTVPGPGVPPSIISGQIAANEVSNYLNL